MPLTGAEVFYLAAYALAGPGADEAALEASAARRRAVMRDDYDTWVSLDALHLETLRHMESLG